MNEPVRLTRHADVVAAATDAEAFSSRTSTHLHVPNGMDGAEHRAFRAVVDRQMTPQIVADLGPMLDEVATEVVAALPTGASIDAVTDLGEVFAVRAQCRWLGWPAEVEQELIDWMAENYAAARAGDPARNAAVAAAFDEIVSRQVAAHRSAGEEAPESDATSRLLAEEVDGRPLSHPEIVSILRNWTAGDLGSLARCVGVIVWRLAERPRWQRRMRVLCAGIRAAAGIRSAGETSAADEPRTADHEAAQTAELDAMLGECLRIDDPFVANRRITTCPVTTASGADLDAGTTVLLDWVAANRDDDVFADRFDPTGHAADNVVFGAGPHICPGRDLSYAELRAVIIALLEGTTAIDKDPQNPPTRHEPPLGGWARVPVVLR